MPEPFPVQCFNCLSEFDALEAIWCSCDPQRPTKVCPFCLGCFCAAGAEFKDAFFQRAPSALAEEIRTLSQSRMLLGEMLVKSKLISTEQLLDALTRQKQDGRRLGEILVESGALPVERLESFLQSQHTAVSVDLSRARVDAMMLRRLGVDRCLSQKILPLEAEAFRDRHIMTLAMADPSNGEAVQHVTQVTGYQVIPGVATADAIESVIRSIFPQGSATPMDDPLAPARPADAGTMQSGPTGRLIELAIRRHASHIIIQRRDGESKIHYRIDGQMFLDRARTGPETAEAAQAAAALRKLAGVDGSLIVPRAARGTVRVDGLEYTILVKLRPVSGGEELSAKILDPVDFPPRLDELNLSADVVDRIRMALDRDSGLILVSAPPQSGAASTIYAIAAEVASLGRPMAMIESPRAILFADVVQEEFFPEMGHTFGDALRRAASGDPRVIVVTTTEGVVWTARDADVAERALIVCRVEAGAAPDALLKLAAAGYPPAAIGGRPTLMVHQRLVRRLCPGCRAQVSTAEEFASALGLPPAEARAIRVWEGSGCDDCRATPGFRGRIPLAHCARLDRRVAEAVAGGSRNAVAAACRAAGLPSLARAAIDAIASGLTSPGEVAKKQTVA